MVLPIVAKQSTIGIAYCEVTFYAVCWIDRMQSIQTTEGFVRPPVVDGGELARLGGIGAKLFARMAAMAAPDQAPGDEMPGGYRWHRGEEWRDPIELIRAQKEAAAPTIDHKPVVSYIDPYGRETILTAPLPLGQRFDLETIEDPRKRANFKKWVKRNRAVSEAREMDSMMEFACRVIDGELEDEKPKRKARSKKVEGDPAKALAQAEAIQRAKHKAEKPQRDRQRRADRRERFVQNGKVVRADRTYLPFSEEFDGTGFRTQLGLFGPAIFSSRIARGAAHGTNKREVYDGSELEPIWLRDMEYLVGNWDKVRGNLVVDLDGRLDGRKWKTMADLRRDLVEILGVKLLPTMIAYRLDADGDIEGGHGFWVLPPGSEVGVCGKSRSEPVRFHSMVQDALVNALMPLGADPGHTNTAKTKCPLAPRWSLACFENFPDLTELAAGLPTLAVDRKEMRREHARLKRKAAGGDEEAQPTQSQFVWNTMNDAWKAAITEGFRTHDQEFLKALRATSSTAYGEWLKAAGIPRIRKALSLPPDAELPDEVRKNLHKQITWRCARRPNPDTKYYTGDNRGRDTLVHEAEGLVGAELPDARKAQGKERKKAAGTITRANQGSDSRAIIREQLALYARLGFDLDDKEAAARFIIRSGKREKSCVYKHLRDLWPSFRDASRYNAGRDTGQIEPTSIASETVEVATVTAPVAMLGSDATVASAASTSGDAGPTLIDPVCRPAEPSSSPQASGRPSSMDSESIVVPIRTAPPASHPSTWLRSDGRRVVGEGVVVHRDHRTLQ